MCGEQEEKEKGRKSGVGLCFACNQGGEKKRKEGREAGRDGFYGNEHSKGGRKRENKDRDVGQDEMSV